MATKSKFNKTLLILFPRRNLGWKIINLFSQNGFRTIAVFDKEKTQNDFVSLYGDTAAKITTIHWQTSESQFWQNLSRQTMSQMLHAPVIIYCAGRDFMKMNVKGTGVEWKINHKSDLQKRLAFIDRLMSRFEAKSLRLWFNLAYGMSGKESEEEVYCNTRYGMIGFNKIFDLNPKFTNIQMVNICLTYFHHQFKNEPMKHCAYCAAEQFPDALKSIHDETGLGNYLLQESEKLIDPA